jgi:hypothetical protein
LAETAVGFRKSERWGSALGKWNFIAVLRSAAAWPLAARAQHQV